MATGNIPLTIPDSAMPKVREEFGGGTNAQTLAAVSAWLSPLMAGLVRDRTTKGCIARRLAASRAAITAAETALLADGQSEQEALAAAWP